MRMLFVMALLVAGVLRRHPHPAQAQQHTPSPAP